MNYYINSFECVCVSFFSSSFNSKCKNNAPKKKKKPECIYKGERYASGAEWSDPDDPCASFKCVAGVVTESNMQCYTPCNNPLSPRKGQCCSTCLGKFFDFIFFSLNHFIDSHHSTLPAINIIDEPQIIYTIHVHINRKTAASYTAMDVTHNNILCM